MSYWIIYSLAAYLVCSIPFGKLISRRVADIDITKKGSGNIGATNVAMEVGLRWGLLTLFLDVLKGMIPVALATLYASKADTGFDFGISAVGLSALLGHQFSLFERFRGGKGVATALGVYIVIAPLSCLVAGILFLLTVFIWRFISLGSIVSAATLPIVLYFFGEPLPIVASSGIVGALICFRHKENIQRLFRGRERKWKTEKPTVKDQEACLAHHQNKNR